MDQFLTSGKISERHSSGLERRIIKACAHPATQSIWRYSIDPSKQLVVWGVFALLSLALWRSFQSIDHASAPNLSAQQVVTQLSAH